ncbi:Uncharacterised protein [Enterobacter cloacae]|nr:Uncharacterised protein [Enterobacter cloacae]
MINIVFQFCILDLQGFFGQLKFFSQRFNLCMCFENVFILIDNQKAQYEA